MKDSDVTRVREISRAYRWIDPAGKDVDFLSAEELENLVIGYGTLNDAERKIINHHIDITIRMLEKLPWPKHRKRTPGAVLAV
jgi:hypothetical protein